MNKLSFFLSTLFILFLTSCSTPTLSTPFGGKVKKEYYTGGGLRSELLMSDETGHSGLLKKYGYDGKLTSKVQIQNGVKNGTETLFDSRGRVLRETPYVNGRKNGVLKVYYPNGDLMAEITFANNRKHGKAVKYKKDGSIHEQAIFKNGRRAN